MASIFLTKRVSRGQISNYIGSTPRITSSYSFSSAHQGPTTESELEDEPVQKPFNDSSSPSFSSSFDAETENNYRRNITNSLVANWKYSVPMTEKGQATECRMTIDPFDELSSFKTCFGTRQKVMYTRRDSWEGNWSLARGMSEKTTPGTPEKIPEKVKPEKGTFSEGQGQRENESEGERNMKTDVAVDEIKDLSQPVDTQEYRSVQERVKNHDNH